MIVVLYFCTDTERANTSVLVMPIDFGKVFISFHMDSTVQLVNWS